MLLILVLASHMMFASQHMSFTNKPKPVHDHSTVHLLGGLPEDRFRSTLLIHMDAGQGLVITKDAISTSRDAGATWKLITRAGQPGQPAAYDAAWAASDGVLYLLSGGRLLTSRDQGLKWEPVDVPRDRIENVVGGVSKIVLVLAGAKSVHVQHQKWLNLSPLAEDRVSAEPDRMLVPSISTSSDQGRTWRSIALTDGAGYFEGISLSGKYGVAWGPYSVAVSHDSGLSWHTVAIPRAAQDDNPVSAAIVDNSVLISLKNGRLLGGYVGVHKLLQLSRFPNPLSQMVFVDSCTGFAIQTSEQAGDALMETSDKGNTWRSIWHSDRIGTISTSDLSIVGTSIDHAFRAEIGSTCSADSD